MKGICSPMQAQVVAWQIKPGDSFQRGDSLVILEAMKMEHELRAETTGRVSELLFLAGELVDEGVPLLLYESFRTNMDLPASASVVE